MDKVVSILGIALSTFLMLVVVPFMFFVWGVEFAMFLGESVD